MELDLSQLKELLKPLKLDTDFVGYYTASVEKHAALKEERQRLAVLANKYGILPAEVPPTKMMIGRRIIHLEEVCDDLAEIWLDMHEDDDNSKWISKSDDLEFSELFANLCYQDIFTVAKKLEYAFWGIDIPESEGEHLRSGPVERRKIMPSHLFQVAGRICYSIPEKEEEGH